MNYWLWFAFTPVFFGTYPEGDRFERVACYLMAAVWVGLGLSA
jgi:hypothetical protein